MEWFANRRSRIPLHRGLADDLSRPDEKSGVHVDSITKVLTDKNDTWVTHSLPSTKTQQYYEMVGKYLQFVYGWKDIVEYTGIRGHKTGTRSGII